MNNTALKIEPTERRILSLPDAARYLNVSKSTMYNYLSRGVIKGFKPESSRVWKFDIRDLDAWIEAQKTGGNNGR